MGLPGTVEAHESVEGVPESVWKKVQTVKQGGGGIAELREKVRCPDDGFVLTAVVLRDHKAF